MAAEERTELLASEVIEQTKTWLLQRAAECYLKYLDDERLVRWGQVVGLTDAYLFLTGQDVPDFMGVAQRVAVIGKELEVALRTHESVPNLPVDVTEPFLAQTERLRNALRKVVTHGQRASTRSDFLAVVDIALAALNQT